MSAVSESTAGSASVPPWETYPGSLATELSKLRYLRKCLDREDEPYFTDGQMTNMMESLSKNLPEDKMRSLRESWRGYSHQYCVAGKAANEDQSCAWLEAIMNAVPTFRDHSSQTTEERKKDEVTYKILEAQRRLHLNKLSRNTYSNFGDWVNEQYPAEDTVSKLLGTETAEIFSSWGGKFARDHLDNRIREEEKDHRKQRADKNIANPTA